MDAWSRSPHAIAILKDEMRSAHDARPFKRALALLDVAHGRPVSQVASEMQVSRATVHNWMKAFASTHSIASLYDHKRMGRPSVWTPDLDGHFTYAMNSDPEDFCYMAVDWTLELLCKHLERVTGVTLSQATVRRRLHADGYVWRRPRYRLIPDPKRDEKRAKIIRKLRKIRPRHVVLAEDETDLRLFPPLQGAWRRRGESRDVKLSGYNAKRTVFGSINISSGKRLYLLTEHSAGEDFRTYLRYVRGHYRGWNVVMLIDGDSCHTANETEAYAKEIGIKLMRLPIRCPELNPMEGIWRDAKKTICANRQYASIEEEAARFFTYLELQSSHTALTKSGLLSETFWLHEFVSKNFCEPA